jgi:rfaE bifunctional protein nucleotidyltransferase chain/domain
MFNAVASPSQIGFRFDAEYATKDGSAGASPSRRPSPSLKVIATLANIAAGLQVAQPGVTPISRTDLLHEFAQSRPVGPSTGKPKRNPLRSLPRQPRRLTLARPTSGRLGSALELSTRCGNDLGFSTRRLSCRGTDRATNEARQSKFITLDVAGQLAERYRRDGKTIVFTNGCFDLLHVGHVSMLEDSARFGDVLIVAINSDASVRRLKGNDRPVVSERDRARTLASLECIDHVLIFDDATPHRLLHAICPDILVKGGTTNDIVGREVVERYGGRIERTGEIPGLSTTALLAQIQLSDVRTNPTSNPATDPRSAGNGFPDPSITLPQEIRQCD